MADPVSLSLGVLQVVVPVAMAALPAIWKQIVTILKRIKSMTKNCMDSTNLACIKVILDTLEQVHNLDTELSHKQCLLHKIKLKAEAVEKALSQKSYQRPKDRISQDIKDITVMMQLLDSNIRIRQGHGKSKEVETSTQASS